MSVSAYQAGLTADSATGGALQSLSGNQATFLKLLTTQLQNQDPLAPTDTNQFTQQLVMYSQVEQQIETNKKLDKITGLMGNTQIQSALSTVGSYVQYPGNSFKYDGNGSYNVDYNLPSAAASSTITVTDANGNQVYSTTTSTSGTTAGDNTYVWNGTTDQGITAPSGTYNVAVTAQDASGNPISPTVSVWGLVTQVQATGTDINLLLSGGKTVSFSNVSNISPNPTYQSP